MSATTNNLESGSNTKDVTFRLNANLSKLSASARLIDGCTNSATEKAAAIGAFYPSAKFLLISQATPGEIGIRQTKTKRIKI